MDIIFESVHNYHEPAVFELVQSMAVEYPDLEQIAGVRADVACIALNNLPPRYIRHGIDMAFYTTDVERLEAAAGVNAAVRYAFEWVNSRESKRTGKIRTGT
jgi:hypothetical protein